MTSRYTGYKYIGAALILLGILVCWKSSVRMGYDLGPIYVMSFALMHGKNAYSLDVEKDLFERYAHCGIREMGYPPSCGFVTAPLTAFSYDTARLLWFGVLIASIVGGVWALMRAFAPQSSRGQYMIACGLTLLCAGTRWCMTPLQGTPLILLCMGLFVLALKTQNTRAMFALAFLAVSYKPTLALPFLILLVVQQQFRLVFGVLAAVAALNVIGFWRMGGMEAFLDYRVRLSTFEAVAINVADPRVAGAMYRCDWVRMGVALTGSTPLGHQFATLLTLLTLLYLGYLAWRVGANGRAFLMTKAFLAPAVCLTLLWVYHQHYDMLLLIAPFIAYLYSGDTWRRQPEVVLFLGITLLFVGLYPLAQGHMFLLRMFGERGTLTMRYIVPVLTTLLLTASLSVLNREVKRSSIHSDDRRQT